MRLTGTWTSGVLSLFAVALTNGAFPDADAQILRESCMAENGLMVMALK